MLFSVDATRPKWQLIGFVCLVFLMAADKAIAAPVRDNVEVAEEQATASIRQGSGAAYCLGSAEAQLSFYSKVISAFRQQGIRSEFFEKRALENLGRIRGLLERIAKEQIASNQRNIVEILTAREEGLADSQQCFSDQEAYISCQEPCRIPGTNDFEPSCTDKCTSTASCNNSKLSSCFDLNSRVAE